VLGWSLGPACIVVGFIGYKLLVEKWWSEKCEKDSRGCFDPPDWREDC
jgi:hypothetical protein